MINSSVSRVLTHRLKLSCRLQKLLVNKFDHSSSEHPRAVPSIDGSKDCCSCVVSETVQRPLIYLKKAIVEWIRLGQLVWHRPRSKEHDDDCIGYYDQISWTTVLPCLLVPRVSSNEVINIFHMFNWLWAEVGVRYCENQCYKILPWSIRTISQIENNIRVRMVIECIGVRCIDATHTVLWSILTTLTWSIAKSNENRSWPHKLT